MSNSPQTTCSGTFYDNGGSGSNYDGSDFTQTFTPSSAGTCLKFVFTTWTLGDLDDVMTIYDGPNTSSPVIGTYIQGSSPGTIVATNASGVLTFNWVADNNGHGAGWVATISCVSPPPSNDNCSGATTINPDITCTGAAIVNGSIENAYNSGITACTGTADDDVWFSFVAESTAQLITLGKSNSTDFVTQFFTGTCGSLTSAGCYDTDPNNIPWTGLTVGNTYYIRVYSYGSSAITGTNALFTLCVKNPTANDNCSGATSINPDATCTGGAIVNSTIENSTNSGISACTGTADDDVWFSFVAESTTQQITLGKSNSTDFVTQFFTGTCGSLTSAGCYDTDPNNQNWTGLTVGNTYYIRVYSYGSSAITGTNAQFTLCVKNPPPPPSNDNCAGATSINPDASCTGGAIANGTIENSTNSGITACTGTADDDVWFSFVAESTTQIITLGKSNSTDFVTQFFTGACGSLTSAGCYDTDPSNQNWTGLTVGNTYYIRVYSYGSSAITGTNAQFTMCVKNPPTAPVNDDPCNATALTINSSCSYSTYTNAGATASSGVPAPGCASYSTGDVWFSFVVPSSGCVIVDTREGVLTDCGMAWYTGSCGSLTLLECDDDDSPNGAMPMISRSGLTAGNTIWVRFWDFGGTDFGTFDICAYNPCGSAPLSGTATASPTSLSCPLTSTSLSATGISTICVTYQWQYSLDGLTGWTNISSATTVPYSYNPSQTLFYRLATTCAGGGATSYSSTVQVTVTGSVPSNDEPCTATALTVGSSCSYSTYTTTCASGSTGPPAPGCASYSGGDVWFSFVVPSTGNITIDTRQGVITDGGMALYSGTCGSLTLVECDDDDSPNGAMPMISRSGLTVGATMFVRFWEYSNDNNGTFDICLYSECIGTPSGGTASASLTSLTCPLTSTSLSVSGQTSIGTTYQWQSSLDGITGWTDIPGATTNPYSYSPSQTLFYRMVITCSSGGAYAYSSTVQVTVSGSIPVNDDPCNSISLAVGSSCSYSTYSNQCATNSTGVPAPGCASYSGGDIWFSFVVPASGCVIINTNTGVVLDGGMALYSGTCGSLTLVECDDDDSPNGAMPMISRSGLAVGTTMFIRFWEYSNDNNGTFSICISDPCSSTPVGGTATASPTTLSCPLGDVTLNCTGMASGNCITYQWQCSIDNSTWNDIPGATTTSYIYQPSQTYYYRLKTICPSSYGTSNTIQVILTGSLPVNDEPCDAIVLPVNSGSCMYQTRTNICASNTSGPPVPGCASYIGSDIWFTATVPASGRLIVDLAPGGLDDMGMAWYSGTCGSLTLIECDDDQSQNGSMPMICRTGTLCTVPGDCGQNATLTPGSSVWIRVWDYDGDEYGTFDICAYEPSPPLAASDCGNPTVISSLPYSGAGLSTCCRGNDYTSSDVCGSSYMNGEDYVFEYKPTSNEYIDINVAGASSNTGLFVTEKCPNSGGAVCVASATTPAGSPSLCGVSLSSGKTYYIIVDTYPAPICTNFNISINKTISSTCGMDYTVSSITYNADPYTGTNVPLPIDDRFSTNYIPISFDFCYDGVKFTQLLVASNAYVIFDAYGCSNNMPSGNAAPSAYCPWSISSSVPNLTNAPRNSVMFPWVDIDPSIGGTLSYQVLGTAPNRRFVLSYNMIPMYGYSCTGLYYKGQLKLFETSNNIEMHIERRDMCSAWNGGAAILGLHNFSGTSSVIVSGHNYPTQWSATNEAWRFTCGCSECISLLPVELLNFNGEYIDGVNRLYWSTVSETNNDYFEVQKLQDEDYTTIGIVDGSGNSNSVINYEYYDSDVTEDVSYYRLKQVDFDGVFEFSDLIAVNKVEFTNESIYPNPASNSLEITFNQKYESINIALFDNIGQNVLSKNSVCPVEYHSTIDITELKNGVYIIKVTDQDDQIILIDKIVVSKN